MTAARNALLGLAVLLLLPRPAGAQQEMRVQAPEAPALPAPPAEASDLAAPPAPATPPAPAAVAWPATRPSLEVGELRLTFSGYLQADVVAFSQASVDEVDPSTGAPLNETRFLIRRARLGTAARWRLVSGSVEVGGDTVSGPSFKLVSAQVAARLPWGTSALPLAELVVGLFRVPFGHDVRQGHRERLFLEEVAVARALFPGDYDLGLQLRGGWRFLRWQLGFTNGEPVGERSLPGRDFNAAKDFVGRLAATAGAGPFRFDVGVSGLQGAGLHPGSPATKDVLVWRDDNEDGQAQEVELHVVGGAPATPSEAFSRFALGFDAELSVDLPGVGALTLTGELAWASNLDRGIYPADPVAQGRDTRELGFGVSLAQALPLGFALGVRYDRYDPDADARDPQGAALVPVDRSVSTWAFVAAWRYEPLGRLVVEYDLNRNALGRDVSGRPTPLASDALTVRAEVGF